jgi:hypothetical protein
MNDHLVLVFCLQYAPSSCIEERPAESLAPAACLRQAQQDAANWLADHPKWLLSAVRNKCAAPAAGMSGTFAANAQASRPEVGFRAHLAKG